MQLTDVTAALVYNDLVALALIDRLGSFRVDVPEDLSVVGWEGLGFAAMLSPGLSTVRVPRYEMGERAVDLLVEASAREDRGHGSGEVSGMPTAFVPRGSTGRAATIPAATVPNGA